ncbi:MAG: T9SS type A sorting domain-containing protein [Ginsengibacter sp.]
MRIALDKLFTILLVMYTNPMQAQSWKEINPPPNLFNASILSTAADTLGNIYAAGNFKNSNNENIVAKWDGQSWSELGAGTSPLKASNVITCIVADKAGNVYAAGGFPNNTGNLSVAKWNGTSWSEVGGANALNPNGLIYAMTLDKQNNLYVAGGFTDGSGSQYVAKWDGTNWSQLGTGANSLKANGLIYSLTTDDAGGIYVGGHFTNANGKYYVAKWSGTNWAEVGAGVPLNANDYISCIKTDNAGNVYAGGAFTNSSGEYFIARWNGLNWAEVGGGAAALKANGAVNAIAISATGIIYAGGFGTNLNGSTNVVKWDGTTWTEIFNVGYSVNDAIRSLSLDNSGNLYAAGDFVNNGGHNYVGEWNGLLFTEKGRQGDNLQVNNGLSDIAIDSKGGVYATGNFTDQPGFYYIAHWDGKTWSKLGGDTASFNLGPYTTLLVTDLSGNLYVTGHFTNSHGKYYIAKWDGHSWSETGNPADPIKIFSPLSVLTSDTKGNIYAGGAFGDSSGFSYTIMKWDGSSSFLYPYLQGSPASIVVDTAGNIYAGNTSQDNNAKYYVEKINENGVTRLGTGANALNSGTVITALAIDGNGHVLASGLNNAGFNQHSNFVAKWDGATWSSAGPVNTGTYTDGYVTWMLSDDAGNVYAASATASNSYFSVAKWDGNNWSELGAPGYFNSLIRCLAKDIAGNIYAAGVFDNAHSQQFVAVYGTAQLKQPEPLLSAIASQYCNAAGGQYVKIFNLPDTAFVSVAVTLDNTRLTLHTDSTFGFNLSSLSAGNHEIKVSYSSQSDTTFTTRDFNVLTAVTPRVNVTASTAISTNNDPVIITAVEASGGGTAPLFGFYKDRALTSILQAEAADNTFSLNAADLAVGDNMVYVRMRTSDTCYTNETSVDSINIKRSGASTGIADPDYPGQLITFYPNPLHDLLRLKGFQSTKSYTISIADVMGKIIFRRTISNATETGITQLTQPGSYWLTVYDNTKGRLLGSGQVIKN